MKLGILLLSAVLLAPLARAECPVGLTVDANGLYGALPATATYTSYLPWTPSAPTVTMQGNLVIVTERIPTITAPPPSLGGPCRTRGVTLPLLPQAPYRLVWEVREENGTLWSTEQTHFSVGGPVVTGVTRPPDAPARVGTMLAVTAAAPGFLHIHYEADPDGLYTAAPEYRAQFVGSELIVEQPGQYGDQETWPDHFAVSQRVEDFDMPLPPPGDYTLAWFSPRIAFHVEPDLPSTRCGLADYKPRFTFGGDHLTMDDFYTGGEARFAKPVVAFVQGSDVFINERVDDLAMQYNSALATTRCHSATVDVPPLAPGRYRVYWRYLVNFDTPRPGQHLALGTVEVKARRRATGK